MVDQVFMSPNNGALVVGIPLFRHHNSHPLVHISAEVQYSLYLETSKPLAYVIDFGEGCQVFAAAWVEAKMINLGDL